MRRYAFFFLMSLLVSLTACGLSVDESCAVVCEKESLCQPSGPSAASCEALCKDLAKDADYATALEAQAECYDEQASYYDDPKGVCVAIRGGACSVQQP